MIRWEVPPSRRIAFVLVLLIALASVAATVTVDFRVGGYTLAAAFLLAAVLRTVLPARYCLGLLVRSRQLDVVMALAFALALALTAHVVPGD